ncbi:MAG: glucose dehydrogenase [Gammaproteobacteria bacterium]|nr:MAG: glucose dehydrogenase [Gammaproteobacteria bacterium]RTZ80374.1 MAG: glucose dehydrogenase [Gammaproteobacteria bacterium]
MKRFLMVIFVLAVPLAVADGPQVQLEPVTRMPEGASPLAVRHAGDGSGRLFIVTQEGRIFIHDGQKLLARPFLDTRSRVTSGGEKGLLGLAFSPDYRRDGRFYVNYTVRRNRRLYTRVSRFRVSAKSAGWADPAMEEVLLEFEQPWGNHNGGDIHFGRDGYLYIGTGDGGAAGDPRDNARNLGNLLGKLLRIDVLGEPSAGDETCGRIARYAIPGDNPFRNTRGSCDEIWAYGLRNPWRWSFDRVTGDLFIGDVGQNKWEEVDLQPAPDRGGSFYGWSCMEGTHRYDESRCDGRAMVAPILEYGHMGGNCSITGGYRYRGPVKALQGRYVFADFCSGNIWFARQSGRTWTSRLWRTTGLNISSFGEDEQGNLYVVDLGGGVYKFVAAADRK